jgi:uncharacterized protein (TIGR00661 family)
MRILYGVVGEGMGHATRSKVLLNELVKEHEVHIVVSGRAKELLEKQFPNVHGIWGYTLAYDKNEVRAWQTLVRNLKGAVSGWPQNIRTYFELIQSFEPDVVISDFESFSYLFAKNHMMPVISVDNMQIINRCKHDPALLAGFEDTFELTRSIVKAKLPGCFHYLISTFFYPPVRKERTTLLPPILRPEILAARSEPGEHLLVYQTSPSNQALVDALKQSGLSCRVYGMRRDLREDAVEGNLVFRPFSEERFIEDLRTARAVVAGGGFTLMGEAVYLHKPVLSVPIGGQFEQVMNALYLQSLGYGMYAKEMSSAALRQFLDRVPACADALKAYQQDGNTRMVAALKEQIARAAQYKGAWKEATQA